MASSGTFIRIANIVLHTAQLHTVTHCKYNTVSTTEMSHRLASKQGLIVVTNFDTKDFLEKSHENHILLQFYNPNDA